MDTKPPRIVVDGVFFQRGDTGIARVWQALLEQWSKTDFARRLVLLDRDGTAPRVNGLRSVPLARFDPDRTGRDAQLLQDVCDREQADLFVSSYYTTPIGTPSVFVAYDMVPEALGCDLSQSQWQEKHHGIAHASAFLAISEHTARDLARFFPDIPRHLIHVCPCGVGENFTPAPAEAVERFRARHTLGRPYFLTVGTRSGVDGYKNAVLFFQGFARLPDRDRFAIVCAGGEPNLTREMRDLAGDCPVSVVRLTDEELRAAYSGAVALAYPSKYEGFGLPVLEAMACGCPVITCRNSSLPEVAQDAALYVGESDAIEMREALQRIQQPEVRQQQIERGLARAPQFSWSKAAAQYERAFRQIADALRQEPNRLPSTTWQSYRLRQSRFQEARARTEVPSRWSTRGLYHRGKLRLLNWLQGEPPRTW